MGEMRSSYGRGRIIKIIVLMIWACAFLFLLNGERYRYYLGPPFGVSLMAGFVFSVAMCVALGKSSSPASTVPWISSLVRALVLLLPLAYAAMTGGAVLDSQAFAKRWAGVGSADTGVSYKADLSVNGPEMQETKDDAELVKAYKAAGPPQVPRALRKMPGMQPGETPPEAAKSATGKGVFEIDIYNLVEHADRARGKQVVTEGMVAWDKTNKNRFYLFRFVVVCCVADAQPIAVLVECNETVRPKQNIWARVEGLADIIKVGG